MPTKTCKPAATPTTITLPTLKAGEHYAGIALVDGAPSHHLILLPGENKECNHKTAIAWAKKHGGELPTSREQSLLFANCKDQFKSTWYWSGDKHASASGYAWYQTFSYGCQYSSLTISTLRARAVRRVAI